MKKKIYLIMIILIIGFAFLIFINTEVNAADSDGNLVIVLDPGHGGDDPGASNGAYGLQEAKVNYQIATYAKAELEKYEGVKVYLTRYADCPTIKERADFAKEYDADLLISLHINSGSNTARGAEVWVTQDNTQVEYYQKSKEIGEKILNKLQNLGIYNRGVSTRSGRADEWYPSGVVKDYYGIIRYAMNYNIRSILVEHCFISNSSDCNFINSSDKLQKIGIADATAIAEAYQLTKKGSGKINVKSISLANPEMNLEITSDNPQPLAILDLIFNPTDASNKEFEIYSSNPDVVRVWQERVRGLKEGTSIITIISNNNQRMFKIKVNVIKSSNPLKEIELDKTKITLGINEKTTIKVNYNPNDVIDKTVYWASSNPEIVRVWGGDIRGLKVGTSIITAISRTGAKIATCEVKVGDDISVPVQNISLNKSELIFGVDQKDLLIVNYEPSDSTIKSSTWESSDPSVVRVYNGQIRGLKGGTAVITAKSEDGEKIATCKVTVVIPVQSISLDKTNITLGIDEKEILTVNYNPSDGALKSSTWESSDPSVVRVYNGQIRGLKEGTAVITAKSEDGGKIATCKVTVKNQAQTNIPVESISLDKTNITLGINEKEALTVNYNPSNSTIKSSTWKSSDSSIVRVYNGQIRGLKEGTAIITAKSEDGGKIATCKVTVKNQAQTNIPVESISLDKTNITLGINEKETLTVNYNPSNSTIKSSTWESSDPSVVRVYNGQIRGLKEGTVIITAKSEDGQKTAVCKVIVKNISN